MIIGITGKNAAGKGETAKYLAENEFSCFSLSDLLREEATRLKIEHTRDNLIKLGNELRKKHGASCLAKKANEKIKNSGKLPSAERLAIDSIRNPEEIKELRKNGKFFLIGVDAPIESRFERMIKRNRPGDAKTLEELRKQEEKENSSESTGQQLDRCLEMSDSIIKNDGTISELHQKIEKLTGILTSRT